MGKIVIRRYDCPCGTLLLGDADGALCMCDWEGRSDRATVWRRVARGLGADGSAEGSTPLLEQAARLLDSYFEGRRPDMQLPLAPVGTPFQRLVWRQLLRLPYGATASYSEVARSIGMPRAVRAVAGAIGANALSIFVPCHRVVGSDGSLTGYAGGTDAKRMLLSLERGS